MQRSLCVFVLLGVNLVAVGCGSNPPPPDPGNKPGDKDIQPKDGPREYRITGTITRDGKPLKWKGEKIALLVIYVPLDRKANRDIYRCQNVTDPKSGTYDITDIPAGKYRVSIQQMDPFPTHDLLQFKYPMHNSPILRDVNGDGTFDIDLPKDLPK